MSYFIIIRGPLGSGKTTISKELAEKLNALHISIDDVLDNNGLDKAPPDAPCIPAENFIKANELVIEEAKRNLNDGKVVIFDGNFYHKEALEHLIENLPFKNYIFTLKVSVEVCIERDAKRSKSYGEGAAIVVHNLVSKFDYGISVDAVGDLDETVRKILDSINRRFWFDAVTYI